MEQPPKRGRRVSAGNTVARRRAPALRTIGGRPSVTVLIATKGRPSIGDAVRSVLASEAIDIELLVVDQSPDDLTASVVGDLIDDERLVIVRSQTTGVSRGRNVGLRLATHDIVLITDDDVTVPVDWARRFHAAVRAGSGRGGVLPRRRRAPRSRARVHPRARGRGTSRRALAAVEVAGPRIGAGMAVRRRDVLSIGGFDEQLGPGGRLRSGEDRDLAARALASGWWVLQIPDAFVVHHGFRTWIQGRSLTRRDWYGIGAAYAKQLKCHNLAIVPVIAHEVIWFGLIKPVAHFLVGHRRNGLRRIGYFASGLVAGLRTRSTPARCCTSTRSRRPRDGHRRDAGVQRRRPPRGDAQQRPGPDVRRLRAHRRR